MIFINMVMICAANIDLLQRGGVWNRTIAIYINMINIEGKLIRTIFKGLMSLFGLVI